MKAEEKCNRCKQFGANGLTPYPCKRIPTRNCPWFIKISDKKYKAILEARVSKINEQNALRKELLEDEKLVEEVKLNTIKFKENGKI